LVLVKTVMPSKAWRMCDGRRYEVDENTDRTAADPVL
jgi:hypothetical protein